MTGTSTLLYLVDDMNIPADTLLTPYQETLLKDEYYITFLNLLEVDPGDDLVTRIMERLETS
jgi:hypothetical protein